MIRRSAAGFTLLEVMVALVVLGVTLAAALQLVGGSLRLARTSADHVRATILATTLLGDLPADGLQEGLEEGAEGPFRWARRVDLDPQRLPFPPGTPGASGVRLARVSVEVRWGQGRRVDLVTLRAWRAP